MIKNKLNQLFDPGSKRGGEKVSKRFNHTGNRNIVGC